MTAISVPERPVDATPTDAPMAVSPTAPEHARPAQVPHSVLMVRPHHFRSNVADCADNHFMTVPGAPPREVAARAHAEATTMVEALRDRGVTVHLFEDEGHATPDSVFPNNWFSTHADGTFALYPMRAEARRPERRPDIIDAIAREHVITRTLDYTSGEASGRYLEGTGAMVIDHPNGVIYACRSHRMSEDLLRVAASELGLRTVVFDAIDSVGLPIYHTNVAMAVGSQVALVGLDSMPFAADRARVQDELEATGRSVINLSREQIDNFAGNALEVTSARGSLWVMSSRAWRSLTPGQRGILTDSADVLDVDLTTIEHAGGSARCMLAGIHLPLRSAGVPASTVAG